MYAANWVSTRAIDKYTPFSILSQEFVGRSGYLKGAYMKFTIKRIKNGAPKVRLAISVLTMS